MYSFQEIAFILLIIFAVSSHQFKLDDVAQKKHLSVKQRFQMSCSILEGRKPINFEWYKNGQLLKPNSKIIIDLNEAYSHLAILDVSANDAGNYSCRASDSIGADSKFTILVVQGLLK